MAASGYTPILLYASGTASNVPLAANLTSSASGAELALNYADGKLYFKNSSGVVTLLAGSGGGGPAAGSNTQIQFNSSGVFGASANLTWSGTVLSTTGLTATGAITLNTTTNNQSYTTTGAGTITISSGTTGSINNMTIGGTTAAAGTFTSITNSGLTTGRVVYTTTGGLETSSANLTFNGTTLTANTIGAFTLGGTIAGGGNQINNVIIGTSTPLAGAFTTLSASTSITNSALTSGRVVYSTTGGLETDSANLTFDGTTLSTAGLSDSGNLTFTGTGNRITGLMDGATIANILAFQTSTTNAGTRLSIISNGTGTASSLDVYGVSDPTNAASLRLRTSGTDASIRSEITGTGTYLPMTFYTGGSERMRLDTSGNVGIGTSSPAAKLDVKGGSTISTLAGWNTLSNSMFELANPAVRFGVGYDASDQVLLQAFDSSNAARSLALQVYGGNVGIGTSSPTNPLTVAGTANAAYTSSKGIVVNYGNSSTSVVVPIGFSWASSIGNQNPYWGMGLIPINFGAGTADLGFYTTGSERMRIDSSGNVGIGTSSPAVKLDVQSSSGSVFVTSTTGTNSASFRANNTGGYTIVGRDSSTGSNFGAAYASVVWSNGAYPMLFATNDVERMRIDSSGNVGIGTSSPSTSLSVQNVRSDTAGTGWFTYTASATSGKRGMRVDTNNGYWFDYYNGSSWSAQMGINSSGNLLLTTGDINVNQTVAGYSNSNGFSNGINQQYQNHISGTGSGTGYIQFGYAGAGIGSITQNGTTGVLYNLTSDYRLKNDIQTLTGAKDFVMALQPKKWQWWDGSGEGVGFIAHEFMEVAKYSGHGEKDAVDADGKPVMQSIQPSSSEVIANLVAHIQNLETRLAALEAR